jgi:type IV pilus assembly protein PilQ
MGTLVSYRKSIRLMIVFCAVMIMHGCAANQKAEKNLADQFVEWQFLADRNRAAASAPQETALKNDRISEAESDPAPAADQPMISPSSERIRTLPDLPVTMHMNNVSVPVLLRTLAKIADLNMMINDSITGQTQLVVNKSPWDQVFTGLLDAYGLSYDWTGDILHVYSAADFKKRQSLLEARNDYENAKTKQELARLQLAHQKRRQEPLTTKIVTIRYANIASLHQNLNQYLSVTRNQQDEPSTGMTAEGSLIPGAMSGSDKGTIPGEKGTIMMDKDSNSLIIHASRQDIDKLMPVIHELDRPVKQVLIEAHIVEAESSTGKALGIQWGGLSSSKTSSDKQISVGGDISPFGQSLQDGSFYEPVDGNVVNLPAIAATGMNLGIMAEKMGSFVLYTQLIALQEEGVLNILSNPSITTQNHQKAIIKSGKEIPYQTVQDNEISIEWKEAVIKLEVTPHVVDNQIVRLEILTHKDELDFSDAINGNPTIITKNAQTSVMLFDGQTTVIGGLNKEKSSDSEQGVPGLKNMPGMGWLFKNMNKEKEKEELLIFITPHILEDLSIMPPDKG